MTDQPNPADFEKVEFPNDFIARIEVSGVVTLRITAASLEEAKTKAEEFKAKVENEEEDPELDEVDEIHISYVSQRSPVYRVTRNGQKMQSSHLIAGDKPRTADERGF